MLNKFVRTAILGSFYYLQAQSYDESSIKPLIAEITASIPVQKKLINIYSTPLSLDAYIINSKTDIKEKIENLADGFSYDNKIFVYVPTCKLHVEEFDYAIKNDEDFKLLDNKKEGHPTLEDIIDDVLLHESAHVFFHATYFDIKSNKNAEEEFSILTTISYGKAPYAELHNVFLKAEKSASHKNVLLLLDKKVGGFFKKDTFILPSIEQLQNASKQIVLDKYPTIFITNHSKQITSAITSSTINSSISSSIKD